MSLSESLPTRAAVERAAAGLREVIAPSPLQPSARLSEALGLEVWLKREDLQPVRSYKLRGAYTLIASLDADQRAAEI